MTMNTDILIKPPLPTFASEDDSMLWYVVIKLHVFTPEQTALNVRERFNGVIVVPKEKALDYVCGLNFHTRQILYPL